MKDKLKIKGDIHTDITYRTIYSTDASAYKEMPEAVIMPVDESDIEAIIKFAVQNSKTIIPRTAGTSLAGQVVGDGIVVDVSRYMTNIIEINTEEKWALVQPGVVLDELNKILMKEGLQFGPETSTANRCMIGGMVGNNACGLHSLIYGSTREHLLVVSGFLSDGTFVEFKPLTKSQFMQKCKLNNLEGKIYNSIYELLKENDIREQIKVDFPDPELKRRNTGYGIDQIIDNEVFTNSEESFNFCKLIAGSEGTLMFITQIKLNLIPLPPKEKAVVCVHHNTLEESLLANLVALKYKPDAIELMDDVILECTKSNIEQTKNRFFVKDNPGAILIVEFTSDSKEKILHTIAEMENEMMSKELGYHFPVLWHDDIKKVWNLRKAGLGLLSNLPGDAKPVSVIEDTAVLPEKLPGYIQDFKQILQKYNLDCVYHAHIATGELHLRPVLDLKNKKDVEIFHNLAKDVALLVKKYKGSLSGEHGDGRLRGEFIPIIIGEKNYQLVKKVKQIFDPQNIFNKGKIVDSPAMNSFLRYKPGAETKNIDTILDFSDVGGIQRLAEKCNGSGDCRKTHIIGGTMCPSYQATKNEHTTTRARANMLREYISNSKKINPFDHKELYDILDLCLSCKGCKSECPSSVDMAKLKAEFLQHYYDANGIPLRTRLIANFPVFNKLGTYVYPVYNFFTGPNFLGWLIKRMTGFSVHRSIPTIYHTTLKKWFRKNIHFDANINIKGTLYLFIDEFTEYNDTQIGIKTVKLLSRLGYQIKIANNKPSGRTYLSKGLLRKAKSLAYYNINLFKDIISSNTPLIGIEPSAILTFRDEYPDLARGEIKAEAQKLALNTFTVEEFIADEMKKGNITKESFTSKHQEILLHGHCQQKAIASTLQSKAILSLPENYRVSEIPSGCCGMAGSFGYEKEHYDISMKVGELVLFPTIKNAEKKVLIAAPGTSCRHQIKDGTARIALHPVEILYDAMK